MPPFFSVVIPTHNRARMLRSALKTVQYQTSGDWECFVVDDGSTDDTRRVLDAFSKDERFRVLRSVQNQGMNASRNMALAQAGGRYVTFLDSDDLWLPDRLQAFRRRIDEAPEAGFLFSNAYLLRWGRIVGTLFDLERMIPEGVVPGHYAIGSRHLPYVTTNIAIRKDAFDRWGPFRTEMRTLDTELFARFLAAGLPVAVLKQPLSVRRLHEEQLTGRYRDNFEESMKAVVSAGASEVERRRLREEVAGEVAMYLVKAARPQEARQFLLETLADAARRQPAWRLAGLPAWLLSSLRAARAGCLWARYHPILAPAPYRKAAKIIAPFLAIENAPSIGASGARRAASFLEAAFSWIWTAMSSS